MHEAQKRSKMHSDYYTQGSLVIITYSIGIIRSKPQKIERMKKKFVYHIHDRDLMRFFHQIKLSVKLIGEQQ